MLTVPWAQSVRNQRSFRCLPDPTCRNTGINPLRRRPTKRMNTWAFTAGIPHHMSRIAQSVQFFAFGASEVTPYK